MNIKKDLIENIKKDYLEQKNTKHKIINDFWSQYQQMAKELSEGIYAEDNHFIYELIQNAEDTISNEKEHILEFILEDNGLIVFNNETGFSEEQIKAICAFGKSTKAKDKNEGYIGEKGIGFKSVFKITDKPAISSNGYRFHFGRLDKEGNTEYIIPHWIDDEELKNYPKEFQNNTHTTLYLPFSKEKKIEKIKKLKKDIKQIEPILLLFLKRLTSISIRESNQKIISTKKFSKKDENLELVSIKNEDMQNKYYVFKKSIDVDQNLDEVKDKNGRRKNVKKREIILAFPHINNQTFEDRIFSFLPTKLHSELNFIIQADFILQSGRENIAIDNEWNQWQFKEIEKFICNEVIAELKKHSKLKFIYLNYFLKNGNSHNKLVENLYNNIIEQLKHKKVILSDNNIWQKPENIILLEDTELYTQYIKILFGENYEQVHKKFALNEHFINTFGIKKVNKKEIIEKICDYFDKKDLNDYDEKVVFELTKFLSKYLNTDSRALNYERELYIRVKNSLPIIPKYKTNKKFYSYGFIYLSSEYKPDIIIENFVDKNEFDFDKYNFLADDYKDNKRLEDFIKKIIDEQKENKNKKTIDFFVKYPEILHKYLQKNKENNYKEILDFLIKFQENNKENIGKIKLILTQNGSFLNSENTIYFSNDTDNSQVLNTLDTTLFELTKKEHKYKEFLQKVFNVIEADILNIILNEYLPKIKKIANNRNKDNDNILLNYTKIIIENFDKFEKDDKKRIQDSLYFISINQKDRYLKSRDIYLSKDLSEIIFNTNSIEKYVSDKSLFDFIDSRYIEIAEKINNDEKVKDFFEYFNFEKNIKINDIAKFIKLIKQNLSLEKNIEALELIAKSIDLEDKEKIDGLENFQVYSQNNDLVAIKSLFLEQISDLNIPYLHPDYRKNIQESYLGYLKRYFLSEYKIEPFIEYLKQNIDFDEAINVYKYLDSQSNNNIKVNNITPEKIRKEFKNSKLIYNKNSEKFYPNEVTWQEEKSNNKLFALSTIYPNNLQNFFIKKVQVSQTKDIRQIINQLKQIKEKNNDYYDLLIDLNNLINSNEEIDKYYNSFGNNKPHIKKNIYENMRKFILEKEGIFILDDGKNNKEGENFYFNDLDIYIYEEKLKNKVFSVSDSNYPPNHFSNLIDALGIKRLNSQKKEKIFENRIKSFDIRNWRELLNFAYDLLFTKYKEKYDKLEDREEELKEINLLNSINIYEKVETKVNIEGTKLLFKNQNENYQFKNNKLEIINNENLIFKLIANKIGNINDKEIKDFYKEIIKGRQDEEEYYKNENLKEKQNFPLEISNETIPIQKADEINKIHKHKSNLKQTNENIKNNIKEEYSQEISDEEGRKTGAEQVIGYNKYVEDNKLDETSPSTITNKEEYLSQYNKKRNERIKEISNQSKKISNRTRKKISNYNNTNYKFGEEETKDFFRNQYSGQCQICGFTFKTKNGINYYERFTWSDYKRVKVKANFIDAGNSLCLCAKCHSIIKGGGDFEATFLTDDIMEMIQVLRDDYDFDTFIEDINSDKPLSPPDCFKEHIDFEDMYFVDIRLNNKDERIYFTEEHLLMFFEFLKL